MPTINKSKRLSWEWKETKKSWASNQNDNDFYNSMEWRRLAKEVRIEEPFCRICKSKGITELATYTDHIIAKRFGGAWFDKTNYGLN